MEAKAAKVDRRVQRTRQVLRDALVSLVSEKGYDQISVQDITDRANINRATFYLHYHDKQELLYKSMQEIYDDLVARMGTIISLTDAEESLQSNMIMFDHVKEYGEFYRVMLSDKGSAGFIMHLLDYMVTASTKLAMPEVDEQKLRAPLDATMYYYSGATLGLLVWWIKTGMAMPVEQITRLACDLDGHDGMWALGIDLPRA